MELPFAWLYMFVFRAGELKMPSKEQESDLHKLRFVQQVGVPLAAVPLASYICSLIYSLTLQNWLT